jgi:hypothetical protein
LCICFVISPNVEDSKVEKCVISSWFVSLVQWFSIGWLLPTCSQRSGPKHCQSVPSAFIAISKYNPLSSIYLFRVACQALKVDPHTCHFQFPVQEFKLVSAGANSQHGIHGPVFLLEPPPVLRFSNATGSQVSCSAHGSPPPDVTWLHHDGSVVTAVPGFRWVHVYIFLTFFVIWILYWTFLIGWYGTLCDVFGAGCTQVFRRLKYYTDRLDF